MFDSTLNPALIWAPIFTGLLILAIFGWRREQASRRQRDEDLELIKRAQDARPPEGSIIVRTQQISKEKADRSGRIMVVSVGTFGANLTAKLLTLLMENNADSAIGSALMIEMDARCRQDILEIIPSVYEDRLVPISFPSLAGGMNNRPSGEVLKSIDRWGPPIIAGAEEACYRHRRFNGKNEEPAMVVLFLSLGGQAITGTLAVKTIASQFATAPFYGFTALPVDDSLRIRAPSIFEQYHAEGVQGFVVSDNLGDPLRHDFGMVSIITGFVLSAKHADAVDELNNALYLLFEQKPGGLARYGTAVRSIPSYLLNPTHPAVPKRYYVEKNSVISTIHTCMDESQTPIYDSLLGVGLDGYQATDSSRYDIVLAAVEPDGLKEDEDAIIQGKLLKGEEKRNLHRLFAPLAVAINPNKPLCHLATISLKAVSNPATTLAQLIQPLLIPQLSSDNIITDPDQAYEEREVNHARAD